MMKRNAERDRLYELLCKSDFINVALCNDEDYRRWHAVQEEARKIIGEYNRLRWVLKKTAWSIDDFYSLMKRPRYG